MLLEVRGEGGVGLFIFEGADEATDLVEDDVAVSEFGGEGRIEDGGEEFFVELGEEFVEGFLMEAEGAMGVVWRRAGEEIGGVGGSGEIVGAEDAEVNAAEDGGVDDAGSEFFHEVEGEGRFAVVGEVECAQGDVEAGLVDG